MRRRKLRSGTPRRAREHTLVQESNRILKRPIESDCRMVQRHNSQYTASMSSETGRVPGSWLSTVVTSCRTHAYRRTIERAGRLHHHASRAAHTMASGDNPNATHPALLIHSRCRSFTQPGSPSALAFCVAHGFMPWPHTVGMTVGECACNGRRSVQTTYMWR